MPERDLSMPIVLSLLLYLRRSKVLKEHEKEKWSTIDYHYMTDESDTKEGVVLQHKMVWRSEGTLYVLCKFLYCMCTKQNLQIITVSNQSTCLLLQWNLCWLITSWIEKFSLNKVGCYVYRGSLLLM